MMRRSWLLALTLMVAGCESPTAPDPRAELEAARARWAAHGGAWYSFTLSRECFCVLSSRPIDITVENGAVVWAEYGDSKAPVESAWLSYLQTVPDLFDLIDDAITRTAASLSTSYDPIYGFPTKIAIDYSATTTDDEVSFTASDFSLGHAVQRP
jgi:hypothetical protein